MAHVTEFGGPDPTRVIGRRIGARIIDSALQTIVLGAALLVMGTTFVDLTTVSGTGATQLGLLETGQLLVAVVISLLFTVLNQIVLVAARGWTFGKLFVGLRCVNALGRPPEPVAAVSRGLVNFLLSGLFGVLGDLVLLLSIMATKGHRSLADLAAKTFVIDSSYEGRLIVIGDRNASAGPESITREEAERLGYAVESPHDDPATAPAAPVPQVPDPPAGVSGTPTYDPSLRTYVIYDPATRGWLKQRRATGEWVAMDGF